MKSAVIIAGVTAFATKVAGHATFQQLWINGKDQESTCARLPGSNSPIQDVTSNDIRCNAGTAAAASKCAVKAGDTVTVEMHQHNTRGCVEEAIGGAHYGPVLVYMSKVEDAATNKGDGSFFKIFQDTWASGGASGSDDFWGTKDLNTNCGKMDVKIPSDLAPGDYLLRAEAIALHAAGSVGGSQHYMTCYQLTVTGSGTSNPKGVSFPGAYSAQDPGLLINIYQKLTKYVAPGPAVIPGGTEAVAGQAGSAGGATGGSSKPTATGAASQKPATTAAPQPTTSGAASLSVAPVSNGAASSTFATTVKPAPTTGSGSGSGGNAGCTSAKYAQCRGNGFSGCSSCASGLTCNKLNDYYSQCL